MIVIALTTQVSTNAEMTALTGITNQEIVYHTGVSKPYMFRTNVSNGDYQSDDLSGWWIEDHIPCLDLNEYKHYRINEINLKTEQLTEGGYTWAGKQFPLTDNAKFNLLGMVVANMLGILTFPIDLNTINDEERHSIADGTELYNIYGTALGTKKSYEDSGTALKDSIMAAIDEAAVAAIIDNR